MSRLIDIQNFGKALLEWQRQMLLDVSLSPSAKATGCLLAHELDPSMAGAWRSQEGIATALGVSKDTVRRAVVELAKKGHLVVGQAKRGRSYKKTYQPVSTTPDGTLPSIDSVVKARVAARRALAPDVHEGSTGAPFMDGSGATLSGFSEGEKGSKSAAERVAPLPADTSTDSITPYPQERANRVRSSWGEPIRTVAPFPSREVREALVRRLSEAGAVSWLDPHGWDESDRTIVTRLAIAAEKLRAECGSDLRRLGVTVVCDKARHQALARQPRPVVASEIGAAA